MYVNLFIKEPLAFVFFEFLLRFRRTGVAEHEFLGWGLLNGNGPRGGSKMAQKHEKVPQKPKKHEKTPKKR